VVQKPIEVIYENGVYLPEVDLWLDPHAPKPVAFVSHAHADHVAPHAESICSTTTKRIVEKRFGNRGDVIGHDFGKPFERDGFRFELIPAGHILGSAQIWIERIADGDTLLYTGDFKLRSGVASEPTESKPARTLIMETTYGLPKYRLPPTEEVMAQLVRFVRETMEDGQVPMLAAYSLGKAQELIFAIHEAAPEIPFLFHSSVARMTRIYGEFGYELPEWETIKKGSRFAGKVVIAPPSAIRSQQLRRVKNRVTAMNSGWGLDPGAKFRYQVDEVFPLSDHADYDDLLRYVEMVDPERVLTLHGFADEFARDIRERGREAWSLTGQNQLELGFTLSKPNREGAIDDSTLSDRRNGGEFETFAATCDRIAAATGKLKKVEILAAYLADLSDQALPIATVFLTARSFGRTESTRALQAGWKILRRAVLEASGRGEAESRELTRGQNEPGRATFLMLEGRTSPEPFSLRAVRKFFERLAATRGPAEKSKLLREQLKRLDPNEAQVLVKILTGDLRIGLKEGLVEESLAAAFGAKTAGTRRAHMLVGDLGETARLAKAGELQTAAVTPFVPIQSMLASSEETAEAIWKRLGEEGEEPVWLEDKFDGIRAQLHRIGDRVEIYSRDLRPLTVEFFELVEPAKTLGADVILDGEIIAFAEGKKLTFFDLQKRLGRRNEGDLFLGPSIPVRFVAFDLLWKDETSLIDEPLRERRKLLEKVEMAEPFQAVEVIRAESAEAIEEAFKAARLRDNEGLIAKDPESLYSPGRRGLSWLKLKKAMATLDCVVVKVEEGHGKRSHVLSDYTFAVRDTRTDELVVIGKAYSGLTDAEIEELTEHFKEHTVSKKRRAHLVTPNLVLEIAFDSLNPSKRHNSGLAMRFPRIKAIRRDKTVDNIDTLASARKLAGLRG